MIPKKQRIRVSSLDRREILAHVPHHHHNNDHISSNRSSGSSSSVGESSSYYNDEEDGSHSNSSSLTSYMDDDEDDEDDSSYFSTVPTQTSREYLREMLVRQYSGSIRTQDENEEVDLHYSSEDEEYGSSDDDRSVTSSPTLRSSSHGSAIPLNEENARRIAQLYSYQLERYDGGTSADTTNTNDMNWNKRKYVVYKERWYMLACISLLNLVSDWTCYSIAPIEKIVSEYYPTSYEKELLVMLFLSANAVASLFEPYILQRVGLRNTVLLGSILLALGSICKGSLFGTLHLSYLRLAFVLCGLSQPLYQCTPAVLTSSFFAEHERTFATSMALNANQIGIGVSFICGPLFIRQSFHVPYYFTVLSVLCVALVLAVFVLLKDAPPTPPSATSNSVGSQYTVYQQGKSCLATSGFTHALAAFTVSAIVINTLSTNFLNLLEAATMDNLSYIGVASYGGLFQLIVLCSSLLVGRSADHTRAYYSVILVLLVLGAFALSECSVVLGNAHHTAQILLICALFVGPMQPVATEMGVDLVFPLASENTVLVLQQVCANACSALILPVFAMFKNFAMLDTTNNDDDVPQLIIHNTTSSQIDDMVMASYDTNDSPNSIHPNYYFSLYVLVFLHVVTTVYFSTFRGKYKRYEHEVLHHQRQQASVPRDEEEGERMHLMSPPRPDPRMYYYRS